VVDQHLHRYRLIEATGCDVPLEILLSAGRYDAAQVDRSPPPTRRREGG